ncbi:MAG: hypothetical protein RL553_724 [Planctomycetota bacterium]
MVEVAVALKLRSRPQIETIFYKEQTRLKLKQSEIDDYATNMAPRLSVEGHAILTVASLLGMKRISDGAILDPDEALVGGLVVIHGNSLVGAYYREISGNDFWRDTYFIFPVYKAKLQQTLEKLAGKVAKVIFPKYDKNKLCACVFYGSGFSMTEIPEDHSTEAEDALAALICKKLASIPEGPELMEIYTRILEQR